MLSKIHKDFINLFYPPLCASCKNTLVKQERYICVTCLCHMPKTNFHMDRDNPMEQLFWGRVNIRAAASLYYFEKGSKCRKVLHQIKYMGHKELAFYLGAIYGRELFLAGCFTDADMLVPVPLHPSRMQERGFNQSEWFAKGLGTGLEKMICSDVLVRLSETEKQINKSRTERWANVENTFRLTDPEKIMDKHILLVDDVVTTGATLESCSLELMNNTGVTLSILTMAYA